MNSKPNKLKKMLVAIVALVLIAGLGIVFNGFMGNPISNVLAKKAAQQYIDANYSGLNLQIEDCYYNFKLSQYLVLAQSPTSQDTAFSVYVTGGGTVLGDDYEFEVVKVSTTFSRLNGEMREYAETYLAPKLDYDIEHIDLGFIRGSAPWGLQLDTKLDIHNPPGPLVATLDIVTDDLTYDKMAQVAKSLDAVLKEENIPIREYNIRLLSLQNKATGSENNYLSCAYYPAKDIDVPDLPKAMEVFMQKK